jgi:hypothetical protein
LFNKYNAKKVTIDGITFDSKLEGARYNHLKELESMGLISDIETHPPFPCVVNDKKVCLYKADFRYKNSEGAMIKGIETPMFRLKKKLVEALYPGTEILVIKKPKA